MNPLGNPYVLLAAGALALLLTCSAYFKGRHDMDAVWQERALVAERAARAKEQELQEVANEITRQYNVDRTRINADLANALERLRQRPARRVSETPVPACDGGDGRSLSAEDAGFLAREAARADELRAALDACQGWAAAVTSLSR